MGPCQVLGEMEDPNDLVAVIGFKLFSWNFLEDGQRKRVLKWMATNLRVKLNWVRNIANHLCPCELPLHLPIFGDLEHPDSSRPLPSRRKVDLFRQVICKVMHLTRLGQQERVRSLFLVVDTRPDHLQAALRFQLDNADIEFLVQDNCRRRIDIVGSHDLGDALVERALEYRFGSPVARVRCCETKLNRIVSKEFADFASHLNHIECLAIG